MPENIYHQFSPVELIRGLGSSNAMGFARLGRRITESEYLQALEIVKDYRIQISNDLKELDSIDKLNEKEIISEALKFNNYNRSKTANYLRMSDRTLYRKIKKYDLTFDNINE
jgi:DNA-binding NtrC family response regulator